MSAHPLNQRCPDCGAPWRPRCPTVTCPGHNNPPEEFPWEKKRERGR